MSLTKRVYLPILIILCLSTQLLFTQQENAEHDVEELLSSVEEKNKVEMTANDLAEDLEQLINKPLNINTANRDDLERLFFLNEFQIVSIIDYRIKHGPFLSIYELSYVFGFNRSEVEKIMPYIYIEDRYYPMINKKGKHLLINKTEYNNNLEEINENLPIKLYNKYSYEKNNIKTGLTMENDSYEDLFINSNKTGFDYYSAYLEYKPYNKRINNIIVGDYSAAFGQGLNVWGKYNTGKNIGSPNSIRKRGQGFSPYTSSNENFHFRGISGSFKLKNTDINIFYSNKNIDASIKQDSFGLYFSAIQQTGYHRTNSEINNEKSVKEEIQGLNICLNKNWFKAGVTYHHTSFAIPLIIEDSPDKQFIPSGKNFKVFSTDVSIFLKHTVLFGEWAISGNKKQAWLAGSNFNLPYSTIFSLLYRNYNKGYYNIFSEAFSENSETRNEKGLYLGIVNTSVPKLTIKGFADYFKFPWLTYSTDAPSYGNEYALLSEYYLNENFRMTIKLRTENKEKSVSRENQDIFSINERYQKNTYRFQLTYHLSENIIFKNRLEICKYQFNTNSEKGFLMYHDIKYLSLTLPLTIYGRFTIFQTESFDTRIYQYENDLRYSFYIPFLYGKGTKYYLMFKYDLKRLLNIYFKTEYINYINIKGVIILKGQLVWKF